MSDDFDRYGPKFICNNNTCTVRPTHPVRSSMYGGALLPLAPAASPFYYDNRFGPAGVSPVVYAAPPTADGVGSYWNPYTEWIECGFVMPVDPGREEGIVGAGCGCGGGGRGGSRSGGRGRRERPYRPGRRIPRTGVRDSVAVARGSVFNRDELEDEEGEQWYGGDDGAPCPHCRCGSGAASVDCRWRRYRLYARAPYGNGIRAYTSSSTYQYAVREENMRDGIFLALSAYPLVQGDGNGVCQSIGCGRRWAELTSGDVIRVPGEGIPYRVHLYSDDSDPYYGHGRRW